MATKYANFFEFGKSMNNNIGYVNAPANPLTQAVIPDYNSHFNHGATTRWARTWDAQSTAYMKELANGWHGAKKDWNKYCETYYMINTDTFPPNLSAINSTAFTTINAMSVPKNTVGQNLLRNTLELLCIYYPSATFKREQFDPNIANSPIVHIPNTLCGNCPAIVYLPSDPDNSRIINAVLKDPFACTDVLCYIWAATFHPHNKYNIRLAEIALRGDKKQVHNKKYKTSKLYKFLHEKKQYFSKYFEYIMNALGEPECIKCETMCAYNFPHHPYHPHRK
jgi:hypothetical protein